MPFRGGPGELPNKRKERQHASALPAERFRNLLKMFLSHLCKFLINLHGRRSHIYAKLLCVLVHPEEITRAQVTPNDVVMFGRGRGVSPGVQLLSPRWPKCGSSVVIRGYCNCF